MSRAAGGAWAPAAILVGGVFLLSFVRAQRVPELRAPLESALPASIGGMSGKPVEVSEAEADVAGFTDYALRVYQPADSAAAKAAGAPWVSIYFGFYDQQRRGRTIHSPKNCLPGAGWEAVSSSPATLGDGDGTFTVNRYLLQRGQERSLVLYWYQGRGRVAYNEYLVKWNLLRDAAIRRRTDEALVRIVVPLGDEGEDEAFDLARQVALAVKPALDRALPL